MSNVKKTNLIMLASVRVADYRIVLGKFDYYGIPAYYCAARDLLVADAAPTDVTVTQDVIEIINAYAALIASKAEKLAYHVFSREAHGIRVPRYKEEDCTPLEEMDSLFGNVLVLDPMHLESDFETGADQLVYCLDEPVNDGTGMFISLLSGNLISAYEDEIIGGIKDEDLPEWARDPLSRLRERMG